MNLISKVTLIGLIPLTINATSLKSMLNYALEHNSNVKAQGYDISSKSQDYKSVSSLLKPTVDVGASYSKLDIDVPDTQIGQSAVGFIKFGMNLYDGGKSKSIKREKRLRVKLAKYSKTDTIKQTLLQVVTLYFNIRTIEDEIKAFRFKSKALQRDYKNTKQRYNLQMITYDEVLKIKSELEDNKYQIEELKYQREEAYRNLSLLVGKKIKHIGHARFATIKHLHYTPSSTIKALQTNVSILNEGIKQVEANKKPKVRLEDTLSVYGYNDYDRTRLRNLPHTQNKISLTMTMNLYDTSTKAKKRSIIFAKRKAREQLKYNSQKERMLYDLARKKLRTQKAKISSARAALNMAKRVYKSAKIKYDNGMIDIITYLDALSKKTLNQALYYKALNDYEIAKANYYFVSGDNYRRVISHIK